MPNEKPPTDRGFGNINEILDHDTQRTNHLLAIGISDYVHYPKLPNALKDVQDFADLMQTQFDFDKNNIKLLKNPSKDEIVDALDEYRKLTEKDNLVVYFAGHGILDNANNQGYWIPKEAAKDRRGQFLSNTIFKEELGAINAQHIFVIVDACFAGAFLSRGADDTAKRLEKDPSRWGLTSGKKEPVSDGRAGENSPFAAALLHHLKTATEPISVMRLCDLVTEGTAANARQTPVGEPLQVTGHKSGQFVFRPKNFKSQTKEDAAFETAVQTNTVFALEKYLSDFQPPLYEKEAKAQIQQLKRFEQEKNQKQDDYNDWRRALYGNPQKEARYSDYLTDHSKPIFQLQALQMIDAFAWEKIRTAAIRYLENEKNVSFRKEAEAIKKNEPLKQLLETFKQQYETLQKQNKNLRAPKAQYTPKKTEQKPEAPDGFVLVKGGTFKIGGKHQITLKDFYIGKYPVTQKEWIAIMGENPSRFKGDDLPVENVNWFDAQEFIKKLNAKTGKNYRLPSEAEWEFAARGGTLSKGFEYAGSNNLDEVGWFWENSGDKRLSGEWDIDKINKNNCRTHSVGQKKPNELGLYDMSGNVWEWCQDVWGDDFNADGSARTQGDETYRVLRGGSWDGSADYCRSAYRSYGTPDNRRNSCGFRLAL